MVPGIGGGGANSVLPMMRCIHHGCENAVPGGRAVLQVVSAYVTCPDITATVTPDLKLPGSGRLLHVDLGAGRRRLGGSALAQAYSQVRARGGSRRGTAAALFHRAAGSAFPERRCAAVRCIGSSRLSRQIDGGARVRWGHPQAAVQQGGRVSQ
jgi:hypothetical protein